VLTLGALHRGSENMPFEVIARRAETLDTGVCCRD